jgi:hypothetical protein
MQGFTPQSYSPTYLLTHSYSPTYLLTLTYSPTYLLIYSLAGSKVYDDLNNKICQQLKCIGGAITGTMSSNKKITTNSSSESSIVYWILKLTVIIILVVVILFHSFSIEWNILTDNKYR